MTAPQAAHLSRSLITWYRRHRRALPWRRSRDPYRIWISEVMLQQTTVKAVIPYYRRFLRRFPTLGALARARLETVLAAWSGLGYYRRARHLHAAARRIVEAHAGRFPRRAADILALPGIGRYTAGAILSIAFGQREPVLDGNVERVLSRLVLLRTDPRAAAGRERLWSLARALVGATASPGDLNQSLMELGATLCTPLDPACAVCPLTRRCAARAAGMQESVPAPRRRRPPIMVRSSVALVARHGRYLMRRRQDTGLMDGLWEFPALGANGGDDNIDRPRLRSLGRLATLRHSITYRRIVVEVHRARLLSEPRGAGYRWVTPAAARRLPVSSLVPKVLEALRDDAGRRGRVTAGALRPRRAVQRRAPRRVRV
ncbi:MAG TPA: A/G-specific adenine glycosylase [Candidatus Polarisedimenticolia bacterium]|nr:A/G-specific adenine glycosylase [Candidatus Polarisedimenticolia bacterium]